MNYFNTVNYYSDQCLKNPTEAARGIKKQKGPRQQQDIWVHPGLQLNWVFCPFTSPAVPKWNLVNIYKPYSQWCVIWNSIVCCKFKSRKIRNKRQAWTKKDHQGHGAPETMEETEVVGAGSNWDVKTGEPSESKFNVNDLADSATFESKDGTENDNYISLDLYFSHNRKQHIFYRYSSHQWHFIASHVITIPPLNIKSTVSLPCHEGISRKKRYSSTHS